jgi:hypothetical protein
MNNLPEHKVRRFRKLKILCSIIVLLALWIGVYLVEMQHENTRQSRIHFKERMAPDLTEPGLTPADIQGKQDRTKCSVNVGIYLDRVVALSMKDLNWVADAYVWFRWKDSSFKMGENFQIVDGWIESKEKKDEFVRGEDHYVLYRIIARISYMFDESRFPCDDHLLTICVEEPSYLRQNLIFKPDSVNSAVSSRVKIQGYQINKLAVVEKPHSYKTSRGDPRIDGGTKATFSQFRMGIWIKRQSLGFFFKMFLPLFISVAVAMLAFFINPSHSAPRFSLGVGALFAAVANSYINSSMLPNTGILSLADVMNIVGTTTILLTLIGSTISLYLREKTDNELWRRFDRISFYIIAAYYGFLNIALPLAASF